MKLLSPNTKKNDFVPFHSIVKWMLFTYKLISKRIYYWSRSSRKASLTYHTFSNFKLFGWSKWQPLLSKMCMSLYLINQFQKKKWRKNQKWGSWEWHISTKWLFGLHWNTRFLTSTFSFFFFLFFFCVWTVTLHRFTVHALFTY